MNKDRQTRVLIAHPQAYSKITHQYARLCLLMHVLAHARVLIAHPQAYSKITYQFARLWSAKMASRYSCRCCRRSCTKLGESVPSIRLLRTRSVCMFCDIYVCVCIYIYIYIHIYTYIYIFIHIHRERERERERETIKQRLLARAFRALDCCAPGLCVCFVSYMYVCMCVYIFMYTYIYIHIQRERERNNQANAVGESVPSV